MPALEQLEIPGLWLLGSEDRSIPVSETVEHLDWLIASGKPFTKVLFEGVGRGMRDLRSGQRAPTFPVIFRWLVGNVTQPPG